MNLENNLETAAQRQKPVLKNYSAKTWFRFIVYSAIGIFCFFINVYIPAYQITIGPWKWGAVAGQSNVLVSHLTNLFRAAFYSGNLNIMPVVVFLVGLFTMYDLFIVNPKKHWHGTTVSLIFSIIKIVGFIFLIIIELNILFGVTDIPLMGWFLEPLEGIGNQNLANFIMSNTLVSITISIPTAAMFLTFLIDYGFVDFLGVLVQRFIRPVFLLPGRAALIIVSAFLGNFSVGHIAVNDYYHKGKFNNFEGQALATSFSTVSVGFLMVMANNTGIGELGYWNFFFWTAFMVTMIVSAVGVRIWPLSSLSRDYCPGVEPDPEIIYKDHYFLNGLIKALDIAENQEPVLKRMGQILYSTLSILGGGLVGATFFIGIGFTLYLKTSILTTLGTAFYPLANIFLDSKEASVVGAASFMSFVEVTMPSLLIKTGEWSVRARYIVCALPVSSIVFLSHFIPSILTIDPQVRFGHLVVMWLYRTVLSLLLFGLIAVLFLPGTVV